MTSGVVIALLLQGAASSTDMLNELDRLGHARNQAWAGICASRKYELSHRALDKRFNRAAVLIGEKVGIENVKMALRKNGPVFGTAPHCPPQSMAVEWLSSYRNQLTALEAKLR